VTARLRPALGIAITLTLASLGCQRSCSGSSATAEQPDPRASGGSGSASGSAESPASSLLGGERGLDHVGVAVKDLDAATHAYHDILGFDRPTEGKLPNGLRNVNYYFADSTYLETLTYWDRGKAEWLASFTDKHEGGLFAVLAATSPEETSAFLAARGIKVSAPFSGTLQTAGEDAMPTEKWKTFFLPDGTLPGDTKFLYFIAYARGPRETFLAQLKEPRARVKFFHKNTALGLSAVWFAVADLDAATKAYESIGLPRTRAFDDPTLGARGQVLRAGDGDIRLLAPTGDGVVATFLRDRGGPGLLGVTLAAGNVDTAAKLISERAGVDLPTYQGLLGKSIRVGPELAQGAWIEFSQR
jgi:catechol 2,3-dioxygenase-like lactoylglutathione lyase family enzyme